MKSSTHSNPLSWLKQRILACGVVFLFLSGITPVRGQIGPDPKVIPMDLSTDAGREAAVVKLKNKAKKDKDAAESVARAKGWKIRGEDSEGRTFELMGLDEKGMPLYNLTNNVNAAISTGANLIRTTAPYNLNGSGFRVGVWDGGSVLTTHQEFTGRVFSIDGAVAKDHATHVGGTIGASGFDANAKGMAPSVRLDSYDWNSDQAEMTAAAATTAAHTGKILISNHSYGSISGWYRNAGVTYYYGNYPEREDAKYGKYDTSAAQWDTICVNAPYYLPFKAAGNDRSDNAPAAGATFYTAAHQDLWKRDLSSDAPPPYDAWLKR